jgi:hypothetical protein
MQRKLVVKSALILMIISILFTCSLGQATDPTWNIQTISINSSTMNEGILDYSTMALDSNDFPHLCYWDDQGDYLMYASWNGADWTYQIVDQSSSGGRISLVIDHNNCPHIAYAKYEVANSMYFFHLNYAKWTNSGWNIQTIDDGKNPSLVLDSNGNPHISYSSVKSYQIDKWSGAEIIKYCLGYANWNGSGWSTQTVDSDGISGSLALDSQGNPHISFSEQYPNNGLKYTSWNGYKWTAQIIDLNSTASSLVLDFNNNPHLIYKWSDGSHEELLKYTIWNGTQWNTQTIDETNNLGYGDASLVLDSTGNPNVCYIGGDWTLKYASLNGINWSISNVTENENGLPTLTLDAQDNPHICYCFVQYFNHGNYLGQLRYSAATPLTPIGLNLISGTISGIVVSVSIIVSATAILRLKKSGRRKAPEREIEKQSLTRYLSSSLALFASVVAFIASFFSGFSLSLAPSLGFVIGFIAYSSSLLACITILRKSYRASYVFLGLTVLFELLIIPANVRFYFNSYYSVSPTFLFLGITSFLLSFLSLIVLIHLKNKQSTVERELEKQVSPRLLSGGLMLIVVILAFFSSFFSLAIFIDEIHIGFVFPFFTFITSLSASITILGKKSHDASQVFLGLSMLFSFLTVIVAFALIHSDSLFGIELNFVSLFFGPANFLLSLTSFMISLHLKKQTQKNNFSV